MQCNSVTVPSHSFTVTSFRPEVDAAHAQHGAGQRRAMPELQLISDVLIQYRNVTDGRTDRQTDKGTDIGALAVPALE